MSLILCTVVYVVQYPEYIVTSVDSITSSLCTPYIVLCMIIKKIPLISTQLSIIRTSSLTDSLLSETIQFAGIQAFPGPAAPRRYRPPACASLIGTHPEFAFYFNLPQSSTYDPSIIRR